MIKVFNSVSIQMTPNECAEFVWSGKRISTEQAAKLVRDGDGVESYIGHADTAQVLTNILGTEIPFRRAFGTLSSGESALIAQVMGGRLPEGATTLPDGITIQFWLVTAS